MPESFRSRRLRWKFNLFPAFRGTGGRITYIAGDMKELRLKVPLSWKTRNYVGTIFGGSMYGAVDSPYMVMLINLLGRDYVVWDKGATIRFRRPGRSTLFATFIVTDEELDRIRELLRETDRIDRTYTIELVDEAGEVYVTVEKLLHIRRRDAARSS